MVCAKIKISRKQSSNTKQPSALTQTLYSLTLTWGLRCSFKGKLDQAIACYQKALQIDPK
ncbi:MAG: tetratricopeptide repeat protein, partial [Scytonema sp. CRU_2_7]|nr:tetratricopeptide repeat protein [Scytonema sp. CRU_2_7]